MTFCFIVPFHVGLTNVVLTKSTAHPRYHFSSAFHSPRCTLQAPATTTSGDALSTPAPVKFADSQLSLFQCPACTLPYPPVAPLQLQDLPNECPNCGSSVLHHDGFVDLTKHPSGSTPLLQNLLTEPFGQSLFELPIASHIYERGWRDRFSSGAGFPGIDKEFEYFLEFVGPADIVVDLSCASGLMSRILARSGKFKRVVATDYSEAMMAQTVKLAREDVSVPEFDAVRADVNALPFVDNSIDAVHCGAALHCYPNVQDGLAEIFRVLKPGGKFFATTLLKLSISPIREFVGERPWLRNTAMELEDYFLGILRVRFFEKDEFKYLYRAAGFKSITVETIQGCVIIKTEKPEQTS